MAKSKEGGYLATGGKHAPAGEDKSMGLKGMSVDEGATRKGTAPSPKTLGPRTA